MPRFSECWRCGNTAGVGIICELCEVAKYCSEKCQRNDIFRHENECIPASILKTCTACRKSGPNLKACTGCYRAFYCDANCQKGNWGRHKIDCEDVKETIQELAQRISTHYFSPSSTSCNYYYWGNTLAFDCLNLVENEGEDYSSALKVLFLGVGDLRNVALTCASLPDSYSNKVLFTLNDRESCELARLVLLLYMLIKGDSEVEKTVTELWYSISLSESTYKYLIKTLKELINIRSSEDLKSATSGLINIEEMHLKKFQDVWKKWLSLRVQGTDWIQKQRVQSFKSANVFIQEKNECFPSAFPERHVSTGKKWLEDGVFRRTQVEMDAFAENPTLTGDDPASRDAPYSYQVQPHVFPFSGWDYLQAKKFKNSSCLVTMFGDYIESILQNFKNKLSKHQISFQVVLCDCMEIKQHIEMNTLYDRILTSNLMDYIFLPVLLKLCSEMLNHSNTSATIITETMMWSMLFCLPNTSQISKAWKIEEADMIRYPPDLQPENSSCREYIDDSCDFYNYLRALFYVYTWGKQMLTECNTFEQPKISVINELGNEFQLRVRDCLRNENKIVFFKLAVNKRIVNFAGGDERFLEWIPLPKE